MPGGLAVDSSTGDIYFTDVGTGALTKASASDGWATTTLLSGLGGDDGLYDVALSCDGSYVYVSAPSDCAVYRAKVGSSAGGRKEKKRRETARLRWGPRQGGILRSTGSSRLE